MKDPGVEEIRKSRHEISAEHGHDLHEVVEYYRQVEQELRDSGRFIFEETSSPDDSRKVSQKRGGLGSRGLRTEALRR